MKLIANQECEMALLGAAMLIEDPLPILAYVDRAWFAYPAHQIIWDAIASIGGPADLVALKHALGSNLARVGTMDYLIQIGEFTPSPHRWRQYADIARDHWVCRQAYERAAAIAKRAEIVDMSALYAEIVTIGQGLSPRTTDLAYIGDVIEEIEGDPSKDGINTGYACIDGLTSMGGIPRSETTLVMGETNQGKTALMGQMVLNILDSDRPVLWATYEMSRSQLMRRLMKHLCGMSYRPYSLEALPDWERAKKRLELYDHDLVFYDASNMADAYYVEDLADRVDALHRARGLDVVVIDYMQLMTSRERCESDVVRLQRVSRQVKFLAMRTGVAVLAGVQVSMGRDGEPYVMGGRRVDQDAGLSVYVHTEGNCRVLKNRHGARNVPLPLEFDPKVATYKEIRNNRA